MTKREQLQKIVDDAVIENSDLFEFTVEFRGRGGWWAIPDQLRWFNDCGEFLGHKYEEAESMLKSILGC